MSFSCKKTGVSIGLCVAPVLSYIFLKVVDSAIDVALRDFNVKKMSRYVDGILVVFDNVDGEATRANVLRAFGASGGVLRSTFKEPKDMVLQFLDRALCLKDRQVCWYFSPWSRKVILDYRSSHSKLVKRGIAVSCLGSALGKSCVHMRNDSFLAQFKRLRASGCPSALLTEVASAPLKKAKGIERVRADLDKKRKAVVPHIHRVSHNLKLKAGMES